MHEPGTLIAGIAMTAGTLWLILRYYWLRLIACAVMFTVWTGFAIAAPLYLAGKAAREGELFQAALTLFVSIFLVVPWFIGASAARGWIKEQRKYDRLWQPWDAQ